jgi:hypothetical protein
MLMTVISGRGSIIYLQRKCLKGAHLYSETHWRPPAPPQSAQTRPWLVPVGTIELGPLGDGGSSNGGWGGAGVQIEGGAGYSGGRTKYGPYGPIAHTIPRSTRAPRRAQSPTLVARFEMKTGKSLKSTGSRFESVKMLLENVF